MIYMDTDQIARLFRLQNINELKVNTTNRHPRIDKIYLTIKSNQL